MVHPISQITIILYSPYSAYFLHMYFSFIFGPMLLFILTGSTLGNHRSIFAHCEAEIDHTLCVYSLFCCPLFLGDRTERIGLLSGLSQWYVLQFRAFNIPGIEWVRLIVDWSSHQSVIRQRLVDLTSYPQARTPFDRRIRIRLGLAKKLSMNISTFRPCMDLQRPRTTLSPIP